MKWVLNQCQVAMNPKRILSLDALRIVAAFSIVMQHVGGQFLPMSFPGLFMLSSFGLSYTLWLLRDWGKD